jgi:6-phosphogluconolactonase (cycloisomerase 2 family)
MNGKDWRSGRAMLAAREFPMKRSITKAMTFFAAAAFVVAAAVMVTAGAAMTQSGNTCAYANDDVFQLNELNTVDGYLVTATSQTYLSPVATGGYGTGGSELPNIVISPVKKILYATDSQSGDVAAMDINPTTCQLTLLGNYPVGGSERLGMGVAISPNGRWLFVAGVKSAVLQPFAIHNDGSLTAVRQKIPLLDRPYGMAVSLDSTTLIMGVPQRRGHGNEVISYSINPSNGMLTQVSIAHPKGYVGSITIDSQSKFVYVLERSSDHLRVGLLEIGSGSTLTFVHTYNFTEVAGSSDLSGAVLSSSGRYLYLTDPEIASVNTLAVNSVTGALKYVTTTSDGTMNVDNPIGLATTKNGAFLFTGGFNAAGSQKMGIFAAGKKDGSLTSLGTFPLSNAYPAWVAARNF